MGLNWTYKDSNFTENDVGDNLGFVYLITNNTNNKKYIGKKLFHFSKIRQIKGKKKRFKVPSDWMNYSGSNDELQKEVKSIGEDNFKREILHLCKSKGECSYLEAREQFDRRVMESDDYYNSWIMIRVRKSHIKNYIRGSKDVRLSETI